MSSLVAEAAIPVVPDMWRGEFTVRRRRYIFIYYGELVESLSSAPQGLSARDLENYVSALSNHCIYINYLVYAHLSTGCQVP